MKFHKIDKNRHAQWVINTFVYLCAVAPATEHEILVLVTFEIVPFLWYLKLLNKKFTLGIFWLLVITFTDYDN